ncbi:MAG: hypothetical protein ACI82G_003310 [Bradymonadia bacterium]
MFLIDNCFVQLFSGSRGFGNLRLWNSPAARILMKTTLSFLFILALCAFAAPAVAAATPVACGQAVNTLDGAVSTTLEVSCPAGCSSSTIWGTDNYSDDSSVCTAAVHAGKLRAGEAGTVTIVIAAGADEYIASSRNGVQSSSWGAWQRGFTFAGGAIALDCYTNAQSIGGEVGTNATVICPAGCATGGTVWGVATYSDDSAVCRAALHAGVITNAGGTALVHITAGLPAYSSSTANGVTTAEWGSWSRSFTVSQ